MGADLALSVALPVREAGVVALTLAVAAAFAAGTARGRALAALAALALTPALLLGDVWGSPQLAGVRERPAAVAVAALVGLAAVAALAALLLRRPAALPLLAVAAVPFRVPVDVGGGDAANLLVPLYLVVGAGGLAYVWERLRRPGDPWALAPHERPPVAVELALLAAVVLYAVQAAYSPDFEQALENVVFFYVPFALLYKLLAGAGWSRRLAVACLGVATALALLFAAIGFWEYAVRDLLWNPKVVASNQFESYFRVNSLFFDPNIYGRFLAIVMTGLAAALLWARSTRTALGASAALAVLWGGLLLTFSQSSFTALLVALALLAALRWGARPVALAAAAAAVVGVAGALAIAGDRSLDDLTSGRASLMRGGVEMFLDRPLIGHGSGSFAERFREREDVSSDRAASASHTIPITVAAEQGIVGLALYGVLLWVAFSMLFAGLGRLRRGDPAEPALVARAAVAAAFAALVLHTQLYAAFLEDPLAWALLGAGAGLARLTPEPGAPARAAARSRTRSSSP